MSLINSNIRHHRATGYLSLALTALAITIAVAATVQTVASSPDTADQSAAHPVEDFGLFDHKGGFHRLHYYAKDPETRAIVLFVQGNGCPLVRKQAAHLHRLQREYSSQGVHFWMLNANPQDIRSDIAAEAEEFGIRMPILIDQHQQVARDLGIHRTAEAIVIEPDSWKIRYRGAIDDRLAYESEKPKAARTYLIDALDALLAGKSVEVPRSQVVGCAITFPPTEPVSYSETIAPMLQNHCIQCHTKGGIGPFALSSHRKVRGWSEMIREVLMTRRMPPWQADPAHGRFANDFSLSPEQTRTLVEWIDAGAPRGDGPDPLAVTQPPAVRWHLGEPDFVVRVPEQEIAAEGIVDYRYVMVDSPVDREVWLRGIEIVPGNTRVLHHVLAHSVSAKKGKRRDQRFLAGYAPGMGPDTFPKGTGRLVRPGEKILFQLHYTTSGKPETDASLLGLYVADAPPERELRDAVIIHEDFAIPAGAREYTVRKSRKLHQDTLLYSMNPHMHLRGKSMRYEAHYPEGEVETLLSVPYYHFDWQRNYSLADPKFLPAGTEIVVHATWDNSTLNLYNPDPTDEVTWGEQTFDEMFYASFRYTHANEQLNPKPKPTASSKTIDRSADVLINTPRQHHRIARP